MNLDKLKVTIIDSMPGTGKTSWSIDKMANTSEEDMNFIYITPYLDEVKRIKDNVINRKFYEPTNKNEKGSKLQGLKDLITKDRDIASTHALFSNVDEGVYQLLKSSRYTLILDEVMNVIETRQVSYSDFDILLNQGVFKIDEETNKIIWLKDEYSGKFDEIKELAKNDNLYYHSRNGNSKKIILLVWTFPVKIFEVFKEIYILTYLFDGQLQRAYYDMYNIEYEYKSVRLKDDKYRLVDYIHYNQENKDHLKQLINIYDGKLNEIGNNRYSLSSSWLKNSKNRDNLGKLKNNTSNYFKHKLKSKSITNMWTTIKSEISDESSIKKVRSLLAGAGYSKGFVPCNARATNEYAHKENLAYLLNRFLNPLDKGFFEDKDITNNEDLWALAELIQWIWRSRIRKNEPINIYLPSKRMRNLLKDYINNNLKC